MSETASLNKTPMSYWIHSAVYLFLTFGMGYIPTESISSLGMSIVGIFIGMLYGWTFIGFIWPSMMSIFALGVCGYFDTPQLAFSNAFSNQLVIFMLLILVFTAYFERSGINKKIAAWFLSRPSVQGRPWFFTFMVLLATFVVGFLVFRAFFVLSLFGVWGFCVCVFCVVVVFCCFFCFWWVWLVFGCFGFWLGF